MYITMVWTTNPRLKCKSNQGLAVRRLYFEETLPECDENGRITEDENQPNQPNMLVFNDGIGDTPGIIHICPWYLTWMREARMRQATQTQQEANTGQPWDTRLSVCNLALEIQTKEWKTNLLSWREWRNQQVPFAPGPQGKSDVAFSWTAADVQFLNAVCKSQPKHVPLVTS